MNITWNRVPGICRAHQQMLVDGKPNGVWIRAVGHPTALRPYSVVTAAGDILERKYSLLVDAKAAAIETTKTEAPQAPPPPPLPKPITEPTDQGNQYVIPGCERKQDRKRGQLELF